MGSHVYLGPWFLLLFINALVPAQAGDGAGMKHFVLVHGLGLGGWCWYKVTASLEAAGHSVTAVDLTSNGNNKVVADNVADIAYFVQPLTDFLSNYEGRVILVGHSLGGSAISYAMEAHPDKIEKAVFLCALMPLNGETVIPITTYVAIANLFLNSVATLKFGNGIGLPSSVVVNLEQAQAYIFNKSPPEDLYLGYSCINPSPFGPLLNVLTLTEARYGSIPRFYIKTTDDNIIPPDLQESYIVKNPPQNVFTVLESDHVAMFSQPEAVVNLLISIGNS